MHGQPHIRFIVRRLSFLQHLSAHQPHLSYYGPSDNVIIRPTYCTMKNSHGTNLKQKRKIIFKMVARKQQDNFQQIPGSKAPRPKNFSTTENFFLLRFSLFSDFLSSRSRPTTS